MAHFNVLVIGSGPGGYVAAIRAEQLGLKAACVEMAELGGVCLNWGCIPSKAILKSAEYANLARHLDDYGISVGEVSVDMPKIIKRSRRVAKKSEKGVKYLFKKYGVTHIQGRGQLAGGGKVVVTTGEEQVEHTADHIIVATGARARWFPGMEPDGEKILTYREAIVSEHKPESVVVLGSGAIGLEFAYFYRAMGCEVTVVEGQDRIAPLEDAECSAELARAYRKLGIKLELGAFCESSVRKGEGCVTTLANGTVIESEQVLLALGVQANISDLGLETAGVQTERGFITTDSSCMTTATGVYAIGDVAGAPMLAHKASTEAHICVERIAGHSVPDLDTNLIPAGTFCQPQIASVGRTEAQLTEEGIAFEVGRFPFAANGKNRGTGYTDGFVKVMVSPTDGELLGCHIIGQDATELLSEVVMAMSGELDAQSFLHAVHSHPTSSEAVMEAVAVALGVSVHM